jgi:serine/threonine protein kinase
MRRRYHHGSMALEEVGPWTLVEQMGEYRMTIAYRATHKHNPERLAVLHRVHSWFEEDAVIRLWLDELTLIERLDAPQVLRLLDVGRAGDRGLYFVHELLEGPTLRSVIARAASRGASLSQEFSIRVALETLRALESAHEFRLPSFRERMEIVHRDIGPWAIRLGWDGSVKVAQFGAARAVAASTGENFQVPDLSFMSCEQIRGEALDARTDVYSTGALLWSLLAGRLPFPRSPGSMFPQIQAIIASDPPDLSSVAPEVPQPLSDAIALATRRVSAERTPTARAFRESLEDAVGDPGRLAISGFLASLYES